MNQYAEALKRQEESIIRLEKARKELADAEKEFHAAGTARVEAKYKYPDDFKAFQSAQK